MFRRRDVSELLESTEEKEDQTTVQRHEPETEATTAEAVPVARAPQRKMTLAEHFAEQAAKPVSTGGPRKPLEKPRMPTPISNAPVTARIQEEEVEDRTKRLLTVGPETCLKGEISHCDRVMIEGQVDAEMSDVELLEIAEGGVFRGTAKVGNAEISGKFDGELSVSGRLVIYERGLVNGKVSYGEIQVMRGGKIVGQISCPDVKEAEAKEKDKAKAAA